MAWWLGNVHQLSCGLSVCEVNHQMTAVNQQLKNWVDEVAAQTRPDHIHWCDGSDEEYQHLISQMVKDGTLLELNQQSYPGCYLHRSDPKDVARVEHLTYICCENEADAGPNNHWMAPDEAHRLIDGLFDGCMRGRTLYVVPYCMGPADSPHAHIGVELTDSPYVVANMQIMTRMGKHALERINDGEPFVRGQHSTGDLSPDRRYILHFPEHRLIKSFGSGYGGNALLGKKCHALRIASWQARDEGWLAEHMLIVGIENPQGQTHYIAGAFPSACGKTNLAMLIPPESHSGWKVWTVGDDIAWLRIGEDGRLWAINPENGYFGVVPGTNRKTNKNAYETIQSNTIFTNVAVTADNEPWWEGKNEGEPVRDWQGRPYDPSNGPAAHPNARFTVLASQNPSYSKHAEDPAGVPISAILFGGRRAELAPLVYEAKNWEHGVLVGAGMASETTAAATGKVGKVRRDPMAMKPFCGYNFADYWDYWSQFAQHTSPSKLPRIFHVNWFRKGNNGKFLWPGFGENLRVLRWILDRCEGKADAVETPIGYLPTPESIDTRGLDLDNDTLKALLSINLDHWRSEYEEIGEYLSQYGSRLSDALKEKHRAILQELAEASRKAG